MGKVENRVSCFFPSCLAAGGALELSYQRGSGPFQAAAGIIGMGLTLTGTHEVFSSETPPRPVILVKFKELRGPLAKVTWNLFCQKFIV